MKDQTKIQLSQLEMELVNNAGWILTKNAIMQKAKWLLESLQYEQENFLRSYKNYFPAEIVKPLPKISRGENYKGLPYLILDHPRCFIKKNIFAIRTMFWWGNFFSITLHLSGEYKKQYEQKIISAYTTLKEKKYFICANDDEWEHHFEKNNFIPADSLNKNDFEKHIEKSSFIKLAQKISLQEWEKASEKLMEEFKTMIVLLGG